MPMFQFKCECGNEFEKLIYNAKKELHKWCKHCDKLTEWMTLLEPHDENYKADVCSLCLGNKYIVPIQSPESFQEPKLLVCLCPSCGKEAPQVVKIEVRGTHSGGPNNLDHSVRFHFDYNAESE